MNNTSRPSGIRATARAPYHYAAMGLASAIMAGHAQAADPQDGPGVEDTIVVTGHKMEKPLAKLPTSLKDTPQSITVLSAELLKQQMVTRLPDALRNVAGITMAAGEGGAQGDNFNLRGFNARGDIYIDGVRDAAQYGRDIFNIESVEVLKGPSSTIFGRGSTGGVINQRTKTPEDDAFATVALTAGTAPSARATADINQPLSGDWGLRLNAMGEKGEVAGRDGARNQRFGVAPSLSWAPEEDTRLVLSYLHQQEDNIPDYGLPFLFGKAPPVPRHNFYGLIDDDIEKTTVNVVTLRLERALWDGAGLTNTTRYGHYKRDARLTAPRLTGVAAGTPLADIEVRRSRPTREGKDSILFNQTDLFAAFTTGALKHNVTTGFDLGRETSDTKRETLSNIPFADLLHPDSTPDISGMVSTPRQDAEGRATVFGVYAMDAVDIGEQFILTGGLRWDYLKASYKEALSGSDFDQTDKQFSYRGGLVWKPSEKGNIYISYGTSFNPSAEALSISSRAADLDPEKNESYELGAKWSLFGERLSMNAAIFRTDKNNARTSDPNDPSGSYVLDGKQRVDGFEIEAVGLLTPVWQLMAAYAYTDSEILRSNDARNGVAYQGKEIANTPRHSFSLWTTYEAMENFNIGGGAFYIGRRYADNGNQNIAPGYMRFDATASYSFGNVQVQLNAVNLTDKFYYDRLHPAHLVPGAGRTVYLTLGASF